MQTKIIQLSTIFFTSIAALGVGQAATAIMFRDMVNNPGVAQDFGGGLMGTMTRSAAGTGSAVNGNANYGNNQVGGELVIVNQPSGVTDGNTTAAGPPASITLNNYVVYSFEFSNAITLSEPFRVHDLDYDGDGANRYVDAVGLVGGNGGSLFAFGGDQSGSTPPAIPGTNNPSGSWQVTSVDAGIAANPASGLNLTSLGSLSVYFHSDPIGTAGFASNPNHSNNEIAVEFDATTSMAFDSLHLVYFNASDASPTSGVQGVSISNTEEAVPEPSVGLLGLLAFSVLRLRRRRA